ncbi:DUF4388 domain-containing protein [Candidatus Viridilinea mediisalina]|uniref:PatA-like N-terminal domain-containing protein n=1 Tax=Candidatus Viridilinea mediisalina TaxID=2024553 RepID=A0A2A6RLI9_9CHLR|nr:DUF4388 domain-containing protein [Candidatus Viridilinea mediisalina]PDW03710.1 hypothetical protein CJ255_07320 [Candidatus Viridilinea mediisalina]
MALEGTLQDMSLSDLFQVFRMGPKTGVLILASMAERGIIYVAEGKVIDAVLASSPDNRVQAAQEEAVIRMLLWDHASFVFRHDANVLNRPPRIAQDSEWLVMEGMRRREDPARATPYQTITLDTQLQLSPLPSSAESGVSLDVNQWRILSQVSSSPNLRSICDATSIEPTQAMRTVAELLAIGLVEIVPPTPAPKAHPNAVHHDPVVALNPATAAGSELATTAVQSSGKDERPQVGRTLLEAIMRRIRGL